jgi:hypothetical protein
MPSNYEVVDSSKEKNPMLGLIGFIVLVVVGGISYGLSIPLLPYVTKTKMMLGAAQILPIRFPPDWTPLMNQLAVTFAIFLVLFVISMIVLFMFMKPISQDDQYVNLDVMRQEVKDRRRSR